MFPTQAFICLGFNPCVKNSLNGLSGNKSLLSAFKFISLFLALSVPAYLVLLPIRELNAFAALSSQFLLSLLFGIPSSVSASGAFPLLQIGSLSAEFIDLCAAKLELAVLFGIVFASFEKPLAYRVKGFAAGALFLFSFNALRISLTLRFFSAGDVAWSAVLHDVFFRASLVVALVTFYAIWYYYGLPRKIRKTRRKRRD